MDGLPGPRGGPGPVGPRGPKGDKGEAGSEYTYILLIYVLLTNILLIILDASSSNSIHYDIILYIYHLINVYQSCSFKISVDILVNS